MKSKRLFVVLGLIFTALLSRFIPHPPNFTAINAVALFGASSIGNIWISLATLLTSLFLSDLVLGFHSTLPFVYLSFSLVILLGRLFNCRGRRSTRLACSAAASLLFFVVANFGVWWATSYYAPTLQGLFCCYAAALPFLGNQLLGDLFYGFLIFESFAAMERFFNSPFAKSEDFVA